MTTIKVYGVEQFIARISRPMASRTLRPAMQASVGILQRDIAKYPRQRAGATYRRTGTLGRRWTTEVAKSGLWGKVGNNTSYGPFVQSSQFQATMHRGRWQTDEQVLQRNTGRIEKIFSKAIDRALDKG